MVEAEQIESTIDKILNRGDFISSKGFEAAYSYAIASGITGTLISVGGLLLTFYVLKSAKSIYKNKKSNFGDEEFIAGFFGFGACIIGVVSLVGLGSSLPYIFAPNWYAFKALLEAM